MKRRMDLIVLLGVVGGIVLACAPLLTDHSKVVELWMVYAGCLILLTTGFVQLHIMERERQKIVSDPTAAPQPSHGGSTDQVGLAMEALGKAFEEKTGAVMRELADVKRTSDKEGVQPRIPELFRLFIGQRPKALWQIENFSNTASKIQGLSGILGIQDPYKDFETNLLRSKRLAWSGKCQRRLLRSR